MIVQSIASHWHIWAAAGLISTVSAVFAIAAAMAAGLPGCENDCEWEVLGDD